MVVVPPFVCNLSKVAYVDKINSAGLIFKYNLETFGNPEEESKWGEGVAVLFRVLRRTAQTCYGTDMCWKLAKMFLFLVDAERVHHWVIHLIKIRIWMRIGLRNRQHLPGPTPLTPPTLTPPPPAVTVSVTSTLPASSRLPCVFGLEFGSRVGLAAGFDKNAEIVLGLPGLGFGFAEVGTVTPRPQPGNPRPRLFREPARAALFNKMGFNNVGAPEVARRLAAAKPHLPSTFVIGVNIGKNKDTSIEQARFDYLRAAEPFEGLSDYLVINVSSPNTPGLRSLQTIEALKPIVGECAGLINKWRRKPPLLLKLAPEIEGIELQRLIEAMESGGGIDGWILTNTWGGTYQTHGVVHEGGWSGEPVREPARKSLLEARKVSSKPIISVGGILSLEEAVFRLKSGADLVQVYTGWIFEGPRFPAYLGSKIDEFEKSGALKMQRP